MTHDQLKIGMTVWARFSYRGWAAGTIIGITPTFAKLAFERRGVTKIGRRLPTELRPRDVALNGHDKPAATEWRDSGGAS